MTDTAPKRAQQPRQRRSAPTAAQALANATTATNGVKIGRPLTYSPELCDRAIALGMKGKHWAAIAREFGVDRATLTKWSGDYPDFSSALARAKAYSQAWWEDDVQKNRKAKHYQAQPVKLVMAGQFKEDYAERPAGSGLEALPDLLAAVEEVAQRRAAAMVPGASAKPVDLLDVALSDPKAPVSSPSDQSN